MKSALLCLTLSTVFIGCTKKSEPAPIAPPADDVVTIHVELANVNRGPFSARLVLAGASAATGQVMTADPALQLNEVYRDDVNKTIDVGTFPHYKVGEMMHDVVAGMTLDGYAYPPATLTTPVTFSVQWLVNGKPFELPATYSSYPTKAVLSANTTSIHMQTITYWMNYAL